jgi:hypothetical protein
MSRHGGTAASCQDCETIVKPSGDLAKPKVRHQPMPLQAVLKFSKFAFAFAVDDRMRRHREIGSQHAL